MYRTSVLISYYNSEKFIKAKLANLLEQTIFEQCEFIFMNGGSPQNEDQYIKPFVKKYPNCKEVIRRSNKARITLYSVWNACIRKSNSNLICNSNTDDLMAPQALEKLCKALESDDEAMIAYPDLFYSKKIKNSYPTGSFTDKDLVYFRTNETAMGSLLMWRKSLHDKFGLFDPKFWVLGDADFFYRLAKREKHIKVEEPLVIYWQGDNLYRNRELREKDELLLEQKMKEEKAMVRRAMFVGRFQPCHLGHEWLIRQKLDKGIPCLIYVRDIPPNERNPYTTEQTVEIIEAAFEGEDVEVIVGPDIESVNWGRGVGYETNDLGECPVQGISATKIREDIIDGNNHWESYVSKKVAVKLKEIHDS